MGREPKWLKGEFYFEKIIKIMMNHHVNNEPDRLGTIQGRLMFGKGPITIRDVFGEGLFAKSPSPTPTPKPPISLRRNEEKRLIRAPAQGNIRNDSQ